MINRNATDALDEAIDLFEENWSPQSRTSIGKLLNEYGLAGDVDALTELIRVDIELRYRQGLSLGLDEYFEQWNSLLDQPEKIAEIAFEDFRSRSAYGHEVGASRWRDLPGVQDEPWFQKLTLETSRSHLMSSLNVVPKDFPAGVTGDAFRLALAEEGFQVVHEIAAGSFSKVYLATQDELADRYVVLKVVDEDLSESSSMAMLQHTNIVPVYSVHRVHSRTVICMPYAGSVTLKDAMGDQGKQSTLSGESLIATVEARIDETVSAIEKDAADDFLSFAPAADDQAVLKPLETLRTLNRNRLTTRIFGRLAAALAHSHARGILHGDLKPSNVLIRNDGEPALLDFNLSQTLGHKNSHVIGGTLPYMAPETYRAMIMRDGTPQPESDIYAMGVMMFQFATGRLPHRPPPSMADTDLQLAIEECKQRPAWRDSDDVPPSLRNIIDRCLEFDAADRYSSSEELCADLENEHASRSLVFAKESRLSQSEKWIRRHPRATSAGTVATALIALLIPVIAIAIHWRQASNAMLAEKQATAFIKDSIDALAESNADPDRTKPASIALCMDVLQKHRVLEPSGYQRFVSSKSSEQQRQAIFQAIQRHTIQVGLLEARRRGSELRIAPDTPADLTVLDRLIASVNELPIDRPSRSIQLLETWRARLASDPLHGELLASAMQTEIGNDSELYLEAVRKLTRHQYSAAQEMFETLAKRKSVPSTLRWTLLARTQYDNNQYESAKLSITKSLQEAPDSSRLFHFRGRCQQRLGNGQYAIADFTQSIELDPENHWPWMHRGLGYLRVKDYDAAIRDFSRVQELVPGEVFSLLKRAAAYRHAGQTEKAEADLIAAKESGVVSVPSLIARALATDSDDPESALADLRHADRIDPENIWVLTNMATILSVDLERYSESIAFFDRAIEIQPNNERALIDRAIQCVRLQRYDDAIESMTKALTLPNDARTLYQAACVYALMPGVDSHRRGLNFLAKAVHAGYDADRIDTDEDLNSLRSLEGFKYVRQAYAISKRGPSDQITNGKS